MKLGETMMPVDCQANTDEPAGNQRSWYPTLGAWPGGGGVNFRVWAPQYEQVEIVLERPRKAPASVAMVKNADGTFTAFVPEIGAGDRYRYRLDGEGPYPDPASRFQPEGVHGPSEIIDPAGFRWSDAQWRGVRPEDLVLYELHVGTFTPAGTFAGVIERLPYLRDLGVTAIELMPVGDFAGRWNWGYDGVSLFAPARCYGRPDDLRQLINAAHNQGLAVLLDVVYNHFGPDGAYLETFSPYYFSEGHHTPWGRAINLDGPHSRMVRDFFVENASYWVHEFNVDGFRLDATHALVDDSPRHFLAELSSRVRGTARVACEDSSGGVNVLLIAEDHRNLTRMVCPERENGWGMDAVWADDFHHQVRRALAGDSEGYYRDFTGSTADLAATVRQGWFFQGQYSQHLKEPRGTDAAGLPPSRFVICLQNHDQVGNRAFGDRLHHGLRWESESRGDVLAAYRAATVLLLCAPQTPLLFMGQEWAASSPFLFFTDQKPELGKLVTEGRRNEFKDFSSFSDPKARERIPDPQDPASFFASRLDWSEREQAPHAGTLRLYRALLELRRTEPALRSGAPEQHEAAEAGPDALLMKRSAPSAATLVVAVRIRGAGCVQLPGQRVGDQQTAWKLVLDTEAPEYSPNPMAPQLRLSETVSAVYFRRPGALILTRGQS